MELTTSSYVVLGHLALRPWTMYELATEMRRNVHYFFPRAESQIYSEPKKLVALGLATAHLEPRGKRTRTNYEITPEGRLTFQEWLATPLGKGPILEMEACVRVALAALGTPDDLRAALNSTRQDIDAMLAVATMMREEYLAGEAPFQQMVIYRSMLHDFLTSFAELVDSWAERSLARMEAWEDLSEAERIAESIALIGDRPAPARRRQARDPSSSASRPDAVLSEAPMRGFGPIG